MKKIYHALFALLVFVSCKKSDLPVDNGCISQVRRQNFGLTGTDSLFAVKLLKQNNIPYNDVQFEYVNSDTVTISVVTNIYQHISAIQYLKGLPVLSYDFGYSFKNGVFQEITGTKYNSVNLDTRAALSLPRLRELYMTEINKNSSAAIAAGFKDSCLVAEFGFYDLNGGPNPHTPSFVKAWRVMPKHASYPLGFFRDDSSQTIAYYTGLIEF
jgi:hypothetical protein